MTVTVTNVDETPEITNPPSDRSYAEIEYDSGSTATDIPIVATFSARDEEMQDITWDLSGEDAGDFTITKDPNTGNGVITFDIPPNFEVPDDDDSLNTYEFTVLATDTASRTNTGAWDYAVTVTDVNERPEFTGTPETSFTLDEHDANEVYTTTPLASYCRPRRRRQGHLVADWPGRRRLRDRRRRRRHFCRRAQLRDLERRQQSTRSRSSLPTSRAARLA